MLKKVILRNAVSALLALAWAAPTYAATIDFDKTYGKGHTGSTLVTKIGTAVNNASTGDIIIFKSTEYDFAGKALTIDKGVTITGPIPETIDDTTYGTQNVTATFNDLIRFNVRSSNFTLANIEMNASADATYFTRVLHADTSPSNPDTFYKNILMDNVSFSGGTAQVFGGNGVGITFNHVSFLDFSFTGFLLDRREKINYIPKITFTHCLFTPDLENRNYNTRGISIDAGNDEHPVVWNCSWLQIDRCMMDRTGVAFSKCRQALITNNHFKGDRSDIDMIHFEEFSNNFFIKNNTFEFIKPSRCIYLDREAQPVHNIKITNNTFKGKYSWILWGYSPYNILFEDNNLEKASANDPELETINLNNFHSGHDAEFPYPLPAKELVFRNNPGLYWANRGKFSYISLKDDTSNSIVFPSDQIIKQTVTTDPKAIIDVSKKYRIRNKRSGEYLTAFTNDANVALIANTAGDNKDVWTLEYKSPYYYSLKNVKTGNYMEVDQGFTLGHLNDPANAPQLFVQHKNTYNSGPKPIFYLRQFNWNVGTFYELLPGGNERKSRIEKSDDNVELQFAMEDGEPKAFSGYSLWEFIEVK